MCIYLYNKMYSTYYKINLLQTLLVYCSVHQSHNTHASSASIVLLPHLLPNCPTELHMMWSTWGCWSMKKALAFTWVKCATSAPLRDSSTTIGRTPSLSASLSEYLSAVTAVTHYLQVVMELWATQNFFYLDVPNDNIWREFAILAVCSPYCPILCTRLQW